ncbi:putative esterase PIR7A [Cinnamomum micranthum f. kanehirae]|uniref:Putative esterase PIR7A n=1 Tax=Cinnamomum micranthum f. kanehirae TaxID=337451 RepID=A0A443NXF4_9MAGN|nr:putative esterase PIR7A [Cinnamomum micranthum f. kanehirae]
MIKEDLTLATILVRPGKPFGEDMSREIMVSEQNYGSVSRVYVASKEDELMKEDFQHWIIENNPPREVREIHGSDHMPMLSKPQ